MKEISNECTFFQLPRQRLHLQAHKQTMETSFAKLKLELKIYYLQKNLIGHPQLIPASCLPAAFPLLHFQQISFSPLIRKPSRFHKCDACIL